jgi:cytochrome c556
MLQVRTVVLSMACAVFLLGVPLALAHQGATGPVKRRMDLMASMGKAMKGIGDMLKGKTVYDRAAAHEHAQAIEQHTSMILEQFPEGSTQPPSEARPTIWQEWSVFEDIATQAQAESSQLRAVLEDGADQRAVITQYAELGRACGACHERYREPQG